MASRQAGKVPRFPKSKAPARPFRLTSQIGGGADATAAGEGLPSTGVGGCNPTPRSRQQAAGGTPNGHEVPFWGHCSTPTCGGHLKGSDASYPHTP